MKETIKKRILFVFKYFIGLALLAWILARVDRQNMVEAILRLDYTVISEILVLAVVNLFFQYRLWKILVEYHSQQHQRRDIISSFFAGFAFRLMVPGGSAEISKVFLLRGGKRGKIIAFGVEKFFQTFLKVAMVAFALPIVFPQYKTILWAVGGSTIVAYFLLPVLMEKDLIRKFQEKDVDYSRIFFYSLLHHLPMFFCVAAQYYILINHNYSVAFAQISLVTIFTLGAGLIPVSVSGLGVRENLAVFLLARYAVPGSVAVGVSLLVFFINAIIPALLGAVIIIKRRHDLKEAGIEIKKITRSAYALGKQSLNGRKNGKDIVSGDLKSSARKD